MNLAALTHRVYFALNPQGAVVTPRAHGIDISKYDLFFLPETATGQLDFVFQRVSYRTTRDEAFLKLVAGVMQVPIRMGYHYLNSDTSWKTQADAFVSYAAPYDYHCFACDFEGAFNVLSADFAYSAWQWIHYVQGRTGKPVLIYTSPSLYTSYLVPSQAKYGIDWNTIPLWTAQWFLVPNPNGTPSNPSGRTGGWKFWQYTDHGDGTLYGVARKTACDLDVYNGTVPQLREWLKIGEPPPPPPNGGNPMLEDKYFKVTASSLNIRSSAENIPTNDLGNLNLLKDDIVHAVEVVINGAVTWHAIDKIWRGGKTIPFSVTSPTGKYWAAEKGSSVWMVETSKPEPLPSPSELNVDVVAMAGKISGTVAGVDSFGVPFSHTL